MSTLNITAANSCAGDNMARRKDWRKQSRRLRSHSTQNFPATRKKGLLLLPRAPHGAPAHVFIAHIPLQPALAHSNPPGAQRLPATSNSSRVQSHGSLLPEFSGQSPKNLSRNLVNSLHCCPGKPLPALQPLAPGRFSPRPYGLNASPPLAMKARAVIR